ncbi:hypothetical protein EVAR_73240_1 [Eumeta japonica]|uniref:Reverse transcriptase zinc-binding domain-containing protein n=1 Tax=Eumeta variegata TaxID=151549 RepID=A0A4C1T6E6_EUMVA|nr:hypothetical protein EVAR_73240_1 [Eumeta japonica]
MEWNSVNKKTLESQLDRKDLRSLVEALAGHYTCNKRLHRMGLSGTDKCRFCGMEESIEHLIADCVALGHRRYRILYTIEEADFLKLPLKELLQFLDVLNPVGPGMHNRSTMAEVRLTGRIP